MKDWKSILRLLGLLIMAEGLAMLLCLIPAIVFDDGTTIEILMSGLLVIVVGATLRFIFGSYRSITDKRRSYVLVTLIWVVLSVFGSIPFVATNSVDNITDAMFESMSGITSTGATIFSEIETLPKSILLWRSLSEWIGGFGIMLLVLAIVPRLGINKYSLYTAEASRADNTNKMVSSTGKTVRQTLSVYIILTVIFTIALCLTGLPLWDSLNMTMTNISSGGFAIYNDSIASMTHSQQYILALEMLMSGINFTFLYLLFTIQWGKLQHKFDQFGFYLGIIVVAIAFTTIALHYNMYYGWEDALRLGTVQSLSVITTTGSVIGDTTLWWIPITFVFIVLSMCGGMAGSTTGGLKVMRVIILWRNVKTILKNRLHPRVVNPVRLNGHPISDEIVTNVMVIFFVYMFVVILGVLCLMLSGIDATEAIGAMVGCITSYGPGLGESGGFGSYAAFNPFAKWLCLFVMLLGRLECLTVIILFVPSFWHRK